MHQGLARVLSLDVSWIISLPLWMRIDLELTTPCVNTQYIQVIHPNLFSDDVQSHVRLLSCRLRRSQLCRRWHHHWVSAGGCRVDGWPGGAHRAVWHVALQLRGTHQLDSRASRAKAPFCVCDGHCLVEAGQRRLLSGLIHPFWQSGKSITLFYLVEPFPDQQKIGENQFLEKPVSLCILGGNRDVFQNKTKQKQNKKHSFVDRLLVDWRECGETNFIQHWGKTWIFREAFSKRRQSIDFCEYHSWWTASCIFREAFLKCRKSMIFVSTTPAEELIAEKWHG